MRVLLVDDEPDFLEQAKIFLEKEKEKLNIDTAISAEKALEQMNKNNYDGIIADYQMPEVDGLDFLKIVREERDSRIPFIIFTGTGREKIAMDALNLGADRYLRKGGGPNSQYGILADAIIQEIKRSKLEERKDFFQISASCAPESIFVSDQNADIIYVNQQAADTLGYSVDELEQMKIFDLDPNFSPENWDEHWEKVREEKKRKIESTHIRKDGTKIFVELLINHIVHGGEEYHFTFARELSERKEVKKELREELKKV